MAYPTTNPIILEQCPYLDITALKRMGFIGAAIYKAGTITWKYKGADACSIHITVKSIKETEFVVVEYLFNGTLSKYSIEIVSTPSRVGSGLYHYFICPDTGKRCRILHLMPSGRFCHKSSVKNAYYRRRTLSRQARERDIWVKNIHAKINAGKEFEKPYFKATYAGAPTKRYTKILRTLQVEI